MGKYENYDDRRRSFINEITPKIFSLGQKFKINIQITNEKNEQKSHDLLVIELNKTQEDINIEKLKEAKLKQEEFKDKM